jgi:hypothetical protein
VTAPLMRIRVSVRPTPVVGRQNAKTLRKKEPAAVVAVAKLRPRFAAEFVGGPHSGLSVGGHLTPDEAVAALIRRAANTYETADDVLDFFASLFGVHPKRTPDVQLARAVRFANRHPMRLHPGAYVEMPDTGPSHAPAKGGAA